MKMFVVYDKPGGDIILAIPRERVILLSRKGQLVDRSSTEMELVYQVEVHYSGPASNWAPGHDCSVVTEESMESLVARLEGEAPPADEIDVDFEIVDDWPPEQAYLREFTRGAVKVCSRLEEAGDKFKTERHVLGVLLQSIVEGLANYAKRCRVQAAQARELLEGLDAEER